MSELISQTVIDHSLGFASSESVERDKMKIQRFLRWMEENGATFPSMTIKMGQRSRQVHATRSLLPDELVLHIPVNLMITTEVARQSESGKLLEGLGDNVEPADYIAAYLLQAKREGGFWAPYVDMLPTDFSHNPLLFSEAELAELTGSYFLRFIRKQMASDASIFDRLPPALKENGFTREEFTWARLLVISRSYGVVVRGKRTTAMVPLADMFEYHSATYVRWIADCETGFIVAARGPVEAGSPIYQYYGERCNAKLLAIYGVCLEENAYNAAEVYLQTLSPDHPCFQHTKKLGKQFEEKWAFRVRSRYDVDATRALFSYLRLACLDMMSESGRPPVDGDSANRVAPISRGNEIAALTMLAAACEQRLQQFPTTLDDDQRLLKAGGLSRNVRNAVKVRHDEKIVLNYFLDLTRTALPVLRDPLRDVNDYAAEGKPYADYFADVGRGLVGAG
jgi:histone-lysine N-methyltransferase SETD3